MANSLREFARYVSLLPWGLFGTLIVFFPLADRLVSTLPVVEEFRSSNSTLAFLISAFGIFYLFSSRFEISKKKDSEIRSISLMIFAFGVVLLSLYLFGYYDGEAGIYRIYPPRTDHKMFLEIPLYCASFLSFTASFNILALKEFMRKYVSKTARFEGVLSPNEERSFLEVEGNGSFQRLETQALGNPGSRMILSIDDNIFWDKSFEELNQEVSRYLRKYLLPNPTSRWGIFAVELDFPANFFKNLRFSVKNRDTNSNLEIKGIAHYNTYEVR